MALLLPAAMLCPSGIASAQQITVPALPVPLVPSVPFVPTSPAPMLPAVTALPTFNAAPVLSPSPLGFSAVLQIPAPRLALAAESGIEAAVDRLLVRDGASQEFFAKVRRLAATLPPEAVRAALALNYKVRVTGYVTEGRPDLDLADDCGGGLHDWGEKGNFVIVAEHVLVPVVGPDGRPRLVGEWHDSVYWENALVHEMGHVLDAAFRLSDDRVFVSAWEADYAAMPAESRDVRRGVRRAAAPRALGLQLLEFHRISAEDARRLARPAARESRHHGA